MQRIAPGALRGAISRQHRLQDTFPLRRAMKIFFPEDPDQIEEKPSTSNKHVLIFFLIIVAAYAISKFFDIKIENPTAFIKIAFITGGIIVFIFCFLNLEMALLGLIFIIPETKQNLPGLSFFVTYGDVYLLIIAFAWVLRLLVKSNEYMHKSPLDRPIVLFIIWSTFSLLSTPNVEGGLSEGVKDLLQTIEYFVMAFYVFKSIIKHRDELDSVLMALALTSMLVSVYGIIEYIMNGGKSYRIESTLGHFNGLGAYLSFMVPLFFNGFISERVKWRKWWIYFVAMSLSTVAIMLTFSRGAWIGVLVAIVLSAWLRGMNQFLRVFSVVMVLIVFASVLLPSRFIGRAASVTEVQDKSTQNRLNQYGMAIEIMGKEPLLGTGIGGLYWYAQDRGTPALYEIHNLFLYMAAERGIPAMLLLIWLIITYYVTIFRRINATKSTYFKSFYIANFSSITAFLIVNLTAEQLVHGVGMHVGVFFGIAMAAMRIEQDMIESGAIEEEEQQLEPLARAPSLIGHLSPGA